MVVDRTTPLEASDSHGLSEVINGIVERVSGYLDSVVRQHRRLPARSFYGESFTALLLSQGGERFAPSVEILQEAYAGIDKEDSQFHWEFNKYAWLSLYRLSGDATARSFALPLRFKNTPVTNWTLLRSCTRYMAGEDLALAKSEAVAVLERYQSRSGIICDQPCVRSFQYHCFSAALLAEIYELGGGEFFLDRFTRAVRYIEKFVLRSGDTLYVGRGQEQSFGYGALVYLFALAYKHLGEPRYLSAAARCLGYVARYHRPDGSFPLVMNEVEVGFPATADPANPAFPGWYQYNNYFDYLPFCAVFLKKAADVLAATPQSRIPEGDPAPPYRDEHSTVVRTTAYEAVVSKPSTGWNGGKGYWTNEIPIPYIESQGMRVTPCYGGEQFGRTIYRPEGLPYPLVRRLGGFSSMRRGRAWSWLIGNTLILLSPDGCLIRRFRYEATSVTVTDRMLGWRPMYPYYLFEVQESVNEKTFRCRGGVTVTSHKPLSGAVMPAQHFCGGSLQALVACKPGWLNRITIWLEGSK